ncbi:MAG: MATE family efflux transporter [Candidatus Neomarinimicrobiota bacterium]|nr:MATE family efflux transporter [Candidatus Neomarinimicrobiota bacterium]RKY49200.1 MAG: MATE family efflux transporter [Candidatus Neomarinimicrobiota bacterium]
MSEGYTEGVNTLLGNPRRAIVKLSLPMIVGMIAQTAYSIADAVWVSGLGPEPLAAVGFFFPVYFLLMSLAGGIGVGASSAISRMIGAKDKESADKIAVQSILLGILLALLVSIPAIPFLERIIFFLGGGEISSITASYGKIILLGSVFMFFNYVANSILRGEGNAGKAMWAMVIGSGINILFDPVFIYVFRLGIRGAAWASVVSMFIVSILFIYWLFFEQKTYVSINLKDLGFTVEVLREIFSVGIPSSVMQMINSVSMFLINVVAIRAGGTDGVAVFTSGWRIVTVGTLPMMGMAMGVTAVTGAAFGARDSKKLEQGYFFAIKMGLVIEIIMGLLIFAFARYISVIFTYAEQTRRISEDLIHFLKVMALFLPFVPLGMLTSAMLQGTRRGFWALGITLTRTIVLNVPLAYLFGIVMGIGSPGVWWGIVCGNAIAGLIGVTLGIITTAEYKKKLSRRVAFL